jgi:hypothetical protein
VTTPFSLPRTPLEPMRKTNPICGKSKAQLEVQHHKTEALPQHFFRDARQMRGAEGGLGGVIVMYSLSPSLYTYLYSGRFLGESKTEGNVLVFPESMPIHRL